MIINTQDSLSSVNAVDFFGVKLKGELSDIIRHIYQLPVLTCIEKRDSVRCERNDVMCFFHNVEFCGVPCGMNVRFKMMSEKDVAIHELNFITSRTESLIEWD